MGAPPRIGNVMVRVEEGGRSADIGCGFEEVTGRCFPACRRRMVGGGWVVRRERRWQRVGRVVSVGMERGIAVGVVLVKAGRGGFEGVLKGDGVLSPERSLTNSWKFSGVEVVDVEEEEEVEEEREGRMVGGGGGVLGVGVVVEVGEGRRAGLDCGR